MVYSGQRDLNSLKTFVLQHVEVVEVGLLRIKKH